jgi:DNA-binding transcriptional MerR regulator
MSERILTLFGEEIVPEQVVKTVGKTRAKKGKDKEEEVEAAEEPAPPAEPVAEEIPTPLPEPVAEEILPAEEADDTVTLNIEAAYEIEPEELVAVADEDEEGEIDEPQEPAQKKEKTTKPPANLPENWEGDKQYYSIGEVAALFNVKTSHIRFWTNEFKLKVRTTRKGDRLYTPAQIKEVRAIYHLVKERGFTLTGAKAKLKSQNKIDVETIDLKQSLLKLRNQLEIIKKQLIA